jgi:hypothetical protein
LSGFADLIADALPYLAVEHIEATQGATWEWAYLLTDHSDANVDMTSGYTGACSIRVKGGGTDVVSVAVTFPTSGQVKCAVTPANSAAVAAGTYYHELTLTRTSDGAVVKAVGGGDSKFAVKKKVA